MTDSLTTPAARDGFNTESPIRAFTDFQVNGLYAIGKGFRPSLAHLTSYLSAMQEREHWMMVQIIEAENPTVIFRRTAPPLMLTAADMGRDFREMLKDVPPFDVSSLPPVDDLGAPHDDLVRIGVRSNFGRLHECSGIYTKGAWWIVTRMVGDEKNLEPLRGLPKYWRANGPLPSESDPEALRAKMRQAMPGLSKAVLDHGDPRTGDPINPAHYDGTACADIGELLTPNAYQVLKYVWRLGKKDDVCVELGKAIWYCRREIRLIRDNGNVLLHIARDEAWFEDRIKDQSTFTQSIARRLWHGYNRGMEIDRIQEIGRALKTELARIECAPGSAL